MGKEVECYYRKNDLDTPKYSVIATLLLLVSFYH